MKRATMQLLGAVSTASVSFSVSAQVADADGHHRLWWVVKEAIQPVMEKYDVPGMAVAITVEGKRHFFNFGVASKESGQKTTENTLFEIGSISKTFTATLASYANVSGSLALADRATKYHPALAGSSFDQISLLDLGTYTAGGLPLQFPADVNNHDRMIAYYRGWRPKYTVGTQRVYSNPSIGLFGYLAAKSMGRSFDELMQGQLFPMLGLTHTYTAVPQDRMRDYAYGYSKDGKPIRVTPGVLDAEAYGVKSTAADMIRFIEANMGSGGRDNRLAQAITATRTGYYKVGDMTQGLGWEMYPYPISLDQLLAGNSEAMIFKANKIIKMEPPLPPRPEMLINKTGSTNGFGAYVAFVPAKQIGVVMLANKNYPVPARINAAHRILSALEGQSN
ncbi:beta-lactamase class C [Microvirga flocculans]|uniref:Beta-lactamase n=1 Tax=Microvirga flocculans TaxID=217168 RepID=A0A7W6IEA7_9HYPH|nr:class C beta-lactamase [Microvirga flocculans]MBB4039859.1 beta-lactamase class C [Microvirga flocculans]